MMKLKTKLALGVVGTAAVSLVVFDKCRKAGQQLFDRAFSTKKREVNEGCWLYQSPYETYQLNNKEGLSLTGYYVPKENPDFTFVIIRGYHGDAFRMSDYAKAFYENFNCDLFLPDLRGHGQSEGEFVGYGWQDKEDVKEWIEMLSDLHPNRQLVLFGLSMGGGTVNFLADQDMPNVKILIEDCGYSTLYQELDFQCRLETKLPLWPFYYGVNQEVRKYCGYQIGEANGLEAVSKAKYPMLFIHGLNDDVVPTKMVFDLYNTCTSEKQMFFVKDTGHAASLKNSYKAYIETMAEFLKEHL